MKVQDLIFGLFFLFVAWRQSEKLAVILGLSFLLAAALLFGFSIFFTAERLSWYAAAFFAQAITFQLMKAIKEKK